MVDTCSVSTLLIMSAVYVSPNLEPKTRLLFGKLAVAGAVITASVQILVKVMK